MEAAEKKALVVGGTSSVGRTAALLLKEMGFTVTVTGRSENSELTSKGIKCLLWNSEKNPLPHQSNEILNVAASTDLLCVCYGPFLQKPLHLTAPEEWEELTLMNLSLPGMLVSKALPFMMKNNYGRIILFGGTRTDAIRSYKTNAAYASAKTALGVLAKSVAAEYSKYNITCNVILPGFTRNAPENATLITEDQLAQKIKLFIENPELNGVLLNTDYGWNP